MSPISLAILADGADKALETFQEALNLASLEGSVATTLLMKSGTTLGSFVSLQKECSHIRMRMNEANQNAYYKKIKELE